MGNKIQDNKIFLVLTIVAVLLLTAPSLWGQRDRLDGWIRNTERVTLRGSAHPLAKAEFDQGPADPNLPLDTIVMGLQKTEQQQADLDRLLTDLQDVRSPDYHRWLTPEQYAERFGISQNDIDKVTAWLELSGFQVLSVARGRDMVLFSGTAGQVEQALRTPIHRYRVNGEDHFANALGPAIPKELAGLVSGIRGLNDFQPMTKARRRPVGTLTELLAGVRPRVQDGQGNNLLVPDDLATIYNLGPLYQAGADGTGQSIAIAGASDIDMADIEGFRKAFNLPFNDPIRILVPKMKNPGQNGAMGEADLDLEWAGAMAPKAQLLYVFSGDPFLSALYAIDQAVAPVLSASFGICEYHLIPDDFKFFRSYSQKAAAQGITWVASSGDSGAAGCENHNGGWTFATTRMSVLMPSTLPEVTAVGGTEFNDGNGSYWAAKPGVNGGSAGAYIPEGPWNDESLILQGLGQGFFDTEGNGFASGGGGASMYWAKPQWQAGPGVPKDGARDVPDVSLTASWYHDPYLLVTGGDVEPNGGTSASAPAFAGILALLNHYLVGTNVQSQAGLGNINPMLYYLGQNLPAVYHDVTTGSNQVPCATGSSQDCGPSGIYGYAAGPGYDLATGWGSVDASKLVATWASVVSKTPKLVITSFTAPAQVAVGGQVSVDVETENQGNADAGAFRVGILFTTDGTQANSKSWYIYCDHKGVAAGQTVSCSGTVALDKSITAGTYIPLAVADYNKDLQQYDRTGNFAYTSNVTMIVK